MTIVTRFAPSPTGYMHLGHAYSALFASRLAQAEGGHFLLRIEDIDQSRCRPTFEAALVEDLAWLGLRWQTPILRQSARLADYRTALDRLSSEGLLYPCFCTRKEIQAEITQADRAPHLTRHGPDGPIYPGTCGDLSDVERRRRMTEGQPFALRLHMHRAIDHVNGPLLWHDDVRGPQEAQPEIFGDVVLARKDVATSYHLAVTVDDAHQGVTLVTRAEDLFPATHIHRLLQELLDLPVPRWQHHPLVTDEGGKRLAKRDRAATLRALRQGGMTPAEAQAMADQLAANAAPIRM